MRNILLDVSVEPAVFLVSVLGLAGIVTCISVPPTVATLLLVPQASVGFASVNV